VLCRKVNKEKISYQILYKKIRKEIDLYIALVYFIIDKNFNYDFYIIDIGDRVFQ